MRLHPGARRCFRDFLHHLADSLLLRAVGICLRKDSHEFVVVVDHGQAANLIRRHEPQCIGEIIVCTHRDGIMSRDFAYWHAHWVLTRRDRANDDVTVCDDAGQLVAIEIGSEPTSSLAMSSAASETRVSGVTDCGGVRSCVRGLWSHCLLLRCLFDPYPFPFALTPQRGAAATNRSRRPPSRTR